MNRPDFIKLFNTHFDNNNAIYNFDVDILNYNDKIAIEKSIQKHLSPFIKVLNIKERDFIKELNIKNEYDSYFEEDEDNTGEYCRYNCKLNVNHFYDKYVLFSNFSIKPITLYRIESSNNEGLYASGFASSINNNDNQTNPYKDSSLKSIFDDDLYSKDEEYKRKWFFAFSKIEHLNDWTNDQLDNLLDKYKLKIKKIIVPSNFVIEGENQTIFQKQHILHEEVINNTDLFINNKKSLKF